MPGVRESNRPPARYDRLPPYRIGIASHERVARIAPGILLFMLKTLSRLYVIMDAQERIHALRVFALMLAVAAMETAGVASIMPFVAVLTDPEVIQRNHYLAMIYAWLGFASNTSFLVFLGAGFLILVFVSVALGALSFWAQVRFAQMCNHAWSCRLMSSYLGQPYEWYLDRHTGALGASVLHETEKAVHGVLFPFMHVVARALVVLSLFALMLFVDPLIAISVVLVVGSVYGVIYLVVRRYLHALGESRRESNEERFKLAQEVFGGIKAVKVGNLEAAFLQRFRIPSLSVARREISGQLISELPMLMVQALVFTGVMGVLLYFLLTRGGLQEALPVFSLFILAGYRVLPSMQEIYRHMSLLRFHTTVLNTLYLDLTTGGRCDEARAESAIAGESRLGLCQELVLEGVSYHYPRSVAPAVMDVDTTVPALSTVGIVGVTGSGKTTLVDVIMGLLEPQEGCLTVDGRRIDAGNRAAWQRAIGYVPQNIYLSDDSIRCNIAFGIPPGEIDPEAVERAARIANLREFITSAMPQGYDTMVGERGVRLSGGQRQRLGIARALYSDPDVILMDEGTSSLDNVTERAVMEAVHNIGRRKTVILVAHRLDTVRECDRIFLMEGGRITASGTFDELLSNNADFRRIAHAGRNRTATGRYPESGA